MQSQRQQQRFAFRMWQYYSLLRMRSGLAVFPLVLYPAPGAGRTRWEEYRETVFGEALLLFRYAVVSLPDLDADDWRDLPGAAGSLAAALTAVMRPGQRSRTRIKFDALVRAATSGLDGARQTILSAIIETYLPLAEPRDSAKFAELVSREAAGDEVAKMVHPYEQRGIEIGIQQGLKPGMTDGLLLGKRQLIRLLILARFPTVPTALLSRIDTIDAPDELDAISIRILTATKPEELMPTNPA